MGILAIMPRSNRARRADPTDRAGGGRGSRRAGRARTAPEPLDVARALGGAPRHEEGPDGDWLVRPVAGVAADKSYTCPGCSQVIRPGTAHVVVWPASGAAAAIHGVELRRHWHTPCWRGRRGRR